MLYILLFVLILALDQWSKYWTVANLSLGESTPFLPGCIELLRVHNYGAAWSSFSGMRWMLVGVTCAIVIAILVLLARGIVRHKLGRLACTLIVAGGIGNIIDRIRLGYVVDMLHLEFFPTYPVFNVADMAVVCGAILGAVYYLYFYEQHDQIPKTQETKEIEEQDGTDCTDSH